MIRILTITCALAFPSIAFAAPSTLTPPPAQPAPVQSIQKADQKPLRLRDPLMLDDRRHQLAPPGRLPGSKRPMPKNGGGPEIG